VYQTPTGRTIFQVATDENALYMFSLPASSFVTDGAAQLWRMLPGQSPTLVGDQLGNNGTPAVQGGYAYFRRATNLVRRRVEGDAPEQQLYAIPGAERALWAVGTDFVVFSSFDGFWVGSLDGTAPLRKIEQELSAPKQVKAMGDRFYFVTKTVTSDSYQFSRFKSVRTVEPFTIEDASPVFSGDLPSVDYLRPGYAYSDAYSGGVTYQQPVRINLASGSMEVFVTTPRNSYMGNVGYAVLGDWLYYYEDKFDDARGVRESSHVDRYLLSDPTQKQEVRPWRPWSRDTGGPVMAVLGDRFYTVKSGSAEVIYEMTLPVAP